jgi:tRNA(adenine34) deaminase
MSAQQRATDDQVMRRALAEAAAASAYDEIPIGAVVLDPDGQVVGAGCNRVLVDGDPTAHAEVVALRAAAVRLGTPRLDGCTLVTTLEPCPMCAGAAVSARVARVVFGAWNEEYGAAGSLWDLLRDRRLTHRPVVTGGVLADECAAVVRHFFEGRREGSSETG